MNLRLLAEQAREMQARLSRELEELRVEGRAGGGAVVAMVSGKKRLIELRIDPKALESAGRELLQDLIVVAVNEAGEKADAELAARVGGALPGLGL